MEWTGQVYADTPAVAAQIYIEAPPERVWALVSDIALMPGLSAELQEVAWLDKVTGPAVGRRFTGRSANAALGQWETVSTVVEQWTQMGPARSGLNLAIDAMPDKEAKIVFVRLREMEAGMIGNLAAIKDMAERTG